MYGNSSDNYTHDAKQFAIRKMKEFGYNEQELKQFNSAELNLMYNRLIDIRKTERIDSMIEKLNESSKI